MVGSDIEIGWRTQLSSEVRPWAIELAAEIDAGDVPASPTSVLTDLLTGLSFPAGLLGSPAVVGTVVTQTVSGLVAGRNYRLVITVGMGGSKQTATVLKITCPY